MTLNHVNLPVTDAKAARKFFEKHFGLLSLEGTNDAATFVGLHDGKGFTLTLMENKHTTPDLYPHGFHIGFLGQGQQATSILYEQLKQEQYDVKPPGHYRKNQFYFHTPWGFTIQMS